MSLEEVKEDVLQEAKEQKEQILESARDQADKIVSEAEEEAQELEESKLEEIEREKREIKRKQISEAKLEKKERISDKRTQALNNVWNSFEERLQEMSEEEEFELIESVVETLNEDIDIGKVLVREELVDDVEDMVDDIDVGQMDDRGVIVTDTSDNVNYNYTFGRISESVRKENVKQLGQIIFGE